MIEREKKKWKKQKDQHPNLLTKSPVNQIPSPKGNQKI